MNKAAFGQKIKEKYPQYADIEDSVLADMVVAKHPAYKQQIDEYQPRSAVTPGSGSPAAMPGPDVRTYAANNPIAQSPIQFQNNATAFTPSSNAQTRPSLESMATYVPDDQTQQYQAQEQAPQKGLTTKIGEGIVNMGKAFFKPVEKLGRSFGESIATMQNQGRNAQQVQSDQQMIQSNMDMARRLEKQGKKEEAMKLYRINQEISSRMQGYTSENLTRTEQAADKGQEDLIKGGIGTAAMFAPSGRTLTGALLAGMGSGGAFGYANSERGNELADTFGGATIGLATAGAFHGAGKLVSKFKSGGEKVTHAGAEWADELEQGTRQIREKPSISGFQKEQQINKVLDKYGIKGTAEQQYSKLNPTMQQIEAEVSRVGNATNKTVQKADLLDSLTNQIANDPRMAIARVDTPKIKSIISGYVDWIVGQGGGDVSGLTFDQMRTLKKISNIAAEQAKQKAYNGTALTSDDIVNQVLWDSIDIPFSKFYPEAKSLLLDESALYSATKSLERARFNPPTQRVAGTSVPQRITQAGRSVAAGILRSPQRVDAATDTIKRGVQKVASGGIGDTVPLQRVAQASLIGSKSGGDQNDYSGQNDQNYVSNEYPYEQSGAQQNNTHAQNDSSMYGEGQATIGQDYVTGASPSWWNQQIQAEMTNPDRDPDLVKYYSDQRDIEISHQKEVASSGGSGTKKLTQQQIDVLTTQHDVQQAIDYIQTHNPQTGPIGPAFQEGMSLFNAGDPDTLTFNKMINNLLGNLAKQRGGTSFTPNEQKLIESYTPKVGDSNQQIQIKLANLKNMLDGKISIMQQYEIMPTYQQAVQ